MIGPLAPRGTPFPTARPAGPLTTIPEPTPLADPRRNPLAGMPGFGALSLGSMFDSPPTPNNMAGDVSVLSMGPDQYAGPLGINTGGITGIGGLIGKTNPATANAGLTGSLGQLAAQAALDPSLANNMTINPSITNQPPAFTGYGPPVTSEGQIGSVPTGPGDFANFGRQGPVVGLPGQRASTGISPTQLGGYGLLGGGTGAFTLGAVPSFDSSINPSLAATRATDAFGGVSDAFPGGGSMLNPAEQSAYEGNYGGIGYAGFTGGIPGGFSTTDNSGIGLGGFSPGGLGAALATRSTDSATVGPSPYSAGAGYSGFGADITSADPYGYSGGYGGLSDALGGALAGGFGSDISGGLADPYGGGSISEGGGETDVDTGTDDTGTDDDDSGYGGGFW
jgi:hypothetical protein